MQVFTSGISEGGDGAMMRHCMDVTRGDEIRANALFWFEFELRQYTSAPLDLAKLVEVAGKYIPMRERGQGMDRELGPIKVVAGRLEKSVVRFPGGHVGYMTVREDFSKKLVEVWGTAV